jgi:TRAP-type uncharacterized transport system substrate-binding protein
VRGSVGAASPIDALLSHEVDVALTTPMAAAGMAYNGRGLYKSAHRELRAIGALPHRDRLGLIVATEVAHRYELRTFADVVARRAPLRIISRPNDGVNPQGFAAEQLLRRFGVTWDTFLSWGGQLVPYRGRGNAVAQLIHGEADGLMDDAIMLWHQFSTVRRMRLLAVEHRILASLQDAYGIGSVEVTDGEYEGIEGGGRILDWSQWIICCRADLAEATGHALAATLVEDRAVFEADYRMTPVHRSPLHYPIKASEASKTAPVPLHAGAADYFAEISKYPLEVE